MTLKEIRPDGQIWLSHYSGGELREAQECLRKAAEEQAARRAVAVAPPPAVALPPPPVAKEQTPSPPRAAKEQAVPPVSSLGPPVWRVGDEWAYRWESPRGKGTFVWSVDREEIVDGMEFYVVKSGRRELFYRKGDIAFYLDQLEGVVEMRHVPPTTSVSWPLVPGKTFEQRYRRERPQEGQTEEMSLMCEVGPEENLTVPAGTFRAFRIACRNQSTGSMNYEMWYSPEVKQRIRDRTHYSYGVRDRELIAFKLK